MRQYSQAGARQMGEMPAGIFRQKPQDRTAVFRQQKSPGGEILPGLIFDTFYPIFSVFLRF